jgi:hypothetical protein
MCIRSVGFGLLAVLWLIAGSGCQKSGSGDTSPGQETQLAQPRAPVLETVARLHWLGKKRLEGETNAAFFMSIWDLPESSKLEAQTLDKLALALADSLSGTTNPASATNSTVVGLVRPLLEDLVREESYFEVRCASNQPGELALAIRLNEDRAAVWRTNFPKLFEQQLTSPAPTASSTSAHTWQIEFENQNSKLKNQLTLDRIGTWTLVALGRSPATGGKPSSEDLLNDFAARIQGRQLPFVPAATNFWLEANFDLLRVADALACRWDLPAQTPRVSLTMIGDGLNVRTRGELVFSKPLNFEFEPWNIPTNLVHNPLMSFTAINGVRGLVASIPGWEKLNIASAPNQAYIWGIGGAAVETFFAAPLQGASNAVYALSGRILDFCNPWLTSNKMGEFHRSADLNGLSWKGFPFVEPFLKEITLPGGGFAYGGLGPESSLTNAPPESLIQEITAHTNLFYYDWEITGSRVEAAIYNSQALRLIAQKAQIPANSVSMVWLKTVSSKLGNCGTEITATDPTRLSFVRKSGFGLTGTELQLLADWLESPSFPRGLYTFVAPSPHPKQREPSGSPVR